MTYIISKHLSVRNSKLTNNELITEFKRNFKKYAIDAVNMQPISLQ